MGRRARSQSFPPRSGFVQVDFELFSRHDACDRRGSPEPHAAGRELGLISWSIPPSLVVSHNMSMINTTSNWLCFCSFPSSPVSSLRIHWPLTTGYCSRAMGHYPLASRPTPHAPRRPPLGPAGSGHAQTLPRWHLCHRPSDCQRPNGTRSRRAPPYLIPYAAISETSSNC